MRRLCLELQPRLGEVERVRDGLGDAGRRHRHHVLLGDRLVARLMGCNSVDIRNFGHWNWAKLWGKLSMYYETTCLNSKSDLEQVLGEILG